MLVVSPSVKIPLREFHFTFVRSSGPGGQNVNKLATKAVLRWNVTQSPSLPEPVRERFLARYPRRVSSEGDLVITSQRFRDQGRNTADCLEKLREMLSTAATPPKRRRKTRVPRSSVESRLQSKRHRSVTKQRRGRPSSED